MKTQKAVALAYNPDLPAPKILAKGSGEIAKKILQKAQEFDVPLFQNAELANALFNTPEGAYVPPELYLAVVEVFVWLAKNEKNAQIS